MKTLVCTVVDKEYMAYIPLFVHCFRTAYPGKEYYIKLFLRDPCPYIVDAELVRMFESFPRYKYLSIALRFVVPPEHFQGYDYVYTGDIDMMMMYENIPFDLFHEREMMKTGLCYSNSTRNKHHYMGEKSLSGLHMATPIWYDKVDKERQRYYKLLENGLVGLEREADGWILYNMCERSGVGIPPKFNLIKRHHGAHLGNFRLFDDPQKWADRVPMEYRIQWLSLIGNGKFRDLIEQCSNDNSILGEQVKLLTELSSGKLI